MYDDSNRGEKGSKNSKSSKHIPTLAIPDPVDAFRVESLHRPPSVPVLGRRLSNESIHNFYEEKNWNHPPIALFKKYRRKSIPDRLDKKPLASVKKVPGKGKLVQKQLEIKPHLGKSKMAKAKSKKLLERKTNLSTPHLRKGKHSISRAVLVTPDHLLPHDIHRPSVGPSSKNSARNRPIEEEKKHKLKEHSSRPSNDHGKNIKEKPPLAKVSKSALSLREVAGKKHLKEVKKERPIEYKQSETPNKKKKIGKNKSEKSDKSSSHSAIAKAKVVKVEVKKVSQDKTPGKRKSMDQEIFHCIENKVKAKMKKMEGKKKVKNKIKKKILIKHKPEGWLDHSFVNRYEERLNLQRLSSSSAEEINEKNVAYLENFSSNDNENLKIEIFDSPNHYSGLNPEITENFNPDPISFESSSSSEEVKLIHPKNQIKERLKLIQDKMQQKGKNEEFIVKIQSLIRGFLTRKDMQKNILEINCENNEKSSSLFYNNASLDQSYSEDYEEVKKIIGEIKVTEDKLEDSLNVVENRECDEYRLRSASPLISQVSEISKVNENKYYEDLENFVILDSLRLKKHNIEDLRGRDLEKIKALASENGAEPEIFRLFQDIINRRYEKINDMFADNIRAVQEALAQSVISEDSSIILQSELKFSKKYENPSHILKKLRKTTPEPPEFPFLFPEFPSPMRGFHSETEPIQYIPEPDPTTFSISNKKPQKTIWIDEVCMPSSIDLTELVIEAGISDLYEYLFNTFFDESWVITASNVAVLSEELIMAILFHEIRSQIEEMRLDFDEQGILKFMSRVFHRTSEELLGPMNSLVTSDPLNILSEIQETEVGGGFDLDLNIPMLNFEAFTDLIEGESKFITIFNKLIFDFINEALNTLVWKEDLPWSYVKKPHKKYRSVTEVQEKVETKALTLNQIKAGGIAYEEMNEAAFLQQREQGVIKILSYEILENDQLWSNYELEEVQAKLDLADMVLESTIEEIIEIITKS